MWLALEHKSVAYELKLLSFSAGDTRKPEFLALNPRGTVPAIVDDGFALFESAAIVEYLDERFPSGAPLFPRDLRKRADCRRIIREIDSCLVPVNEQLVEQLFFTAPEARNASVIETAKTAYIAELAVWEKRLEKDFLVGSTLSAADLALYPIIAMAVRLELRQAELGLVAARGPRLAAWAARIEALPYFDKTYPPHWR